MAITQRLAEEICALTYESVPEAARLQIRRLIADHVGVTFMGWRFTGAPYDGYAAAQGGPAEAVLIGSGRRVPAELAAGINAQACRNTDYEETGPGLHAGPIVAMAALAAGERVGASGRAVIAAAALGYELNARFFFARRDGDVRHFSLCAAAVAAKLFGLDAAATNRALGLALEMPSKSVLYLTPKIAKRVSRIGMANLVSTRQGIQAALLVQNGLDALPDEIDTLGADYDLAQLVASPSPFHYTATMLMLKPWPSSRFCHGALQIADRIRRAQNLAAAEIDRVVMHLAQIYTMPHQTDPAPDDYWQAIYSAQWAVAMVLLGIPPGPDWFTPERLADPVARALAARVSLVEDPEATAVFGSRAWLDVPNTIEIHARGQVWRERITFRSVLGTPGAPMPPELFDGKFLRLVEPALGAERARQLLAGLHDLDAAADIRSVTNLMVAQREHGA